MIDHKVVVVGAGPAGIAAAVALKDRRLRPLVVDQAEEVAPAWRTRYDRLRLNTCRPFSHLPGRKFPKGTPMFASRDQLIEHLDRHAHEDGIDLRLGTHVRRIERSNGSWALDTSAGELQAPQVIVATGYEQHPIVPDWPGRERFSGEILHSREYRNPEPFRDKRVLVVGPGCSGMMGVALLHLPARFGDAVARFGRKQDLGDLTEYGLPIPEEGVMSRLHRSGQAPAIVDNEVIESIKAGLIQVVRGVESFDETGVNLAGGSRVEPDVVICATGFSRLLEPLVGHLGVLDERGMPRALAQAPAAPGLRFIGYVPRPGGLGYMGKEGRLAAKAIAAELRVAAYRSRDAA